jgi:hypothetical protein
MYVIGTKAGLPDVWWAGRGRISFYFNEAHVVNSSKTMKHATDVLQSLGYLTHKLVPFWSNT